MTSSPQISRDAFERILIAIVVLGLLYSAGMLAFTWNKPLLDMHSFRQTQTALTVRWMARGGPLLAYQTPVLGYPWTIPFEFPLFQWTALLLNRAGIDLDNAGRTASWLYFIAGLPLAAFTVRKWTGDRSLVLIFLSLWVFSPLYVYWSRAFMIESCATFFSLAFLAGLTNYLSRCSEPGKLARPSLQLLLLVLAAVAAALVKITTFVGFAIAGGALTLWTIWRSWKANQNLAAVIGIGSGPALAVIASLAATRVWVVFIDAAKGGNPIASQLTSSALESWNFGIQRILTPTMWQIIFGAAPLETLGSRLAIFIIPATALLLPRLRAHVYAGFLLYLAPFFIFTNLHYIHNYYHYANALFLLYAVAAGVWALSRADLDWPRMSGGQARAAALALLTIVVVGEVATLQSRFMPAFRPARDKAELIELANWLSHETAPDEAIFIIGYDWSSALPYYADRRSVMFPAPYADASLRHSPTDLALWTGGRPVGAVVDCGGQADARLSTWMRPLETRYATSTIVTGCRVYH